MTKGSIEQSTEYHETIVANNLTGNNISITSGNDTTMISTNFFNIDGTTKEFDKENINSDINTNNGINLNISGNLNISTATEQHISEYDKDEWGGDIGRAALGGAITGLATGLGMNAGKFMGDYLGNAVSNSLAGTTGRYLGVATNGALISSTLSFAGVVGSSMSQTTISGGSLKEVLASGRDSVRDKESIKNIMIAGLIGGVGGALGEWIKDVKADYMKKTGNNVSTGESTIFDQKSVNSGWSDSKLGVNSEYIPNPLNPDKNILVKTGTEGSILEQTSYLSSNQNKAFKLLNLLPGSPTFVDFHDALNLEGHFNWMSIAPAYTISQFNALYPYYPILIYYNNNEGKK